MISKKEKENHWKFLYLASNQDAFEVGTTLSVSAGNTFTYANTSDGNKNMFNKLSYATKTYRNVSASNTNFNVITENLMDDAKEQSNTTNDINAGDVSTTKQQNSQ